MKRIPEMDFDIDHTPWSMPEEAKKPKTDWLAWLAYAFVAVGALACVGIGVYVAVNT